METKNSNFARGNTVSHLTYIGDSDVGKYCNFGCGTRHLQLRRAEQVAAPPSGTTASSGCNTNLVAPVSVGDGAYTAAGSTVTQDVPAGALAIERGRQANVEGLGRPQDGSLHRQKKQRLEAEQRQAEQSEQG